MLLKKGLFLIHFILASQAVGAAETTVVAIKNDKSKCNKNSFDNVFTDSDDEMYDSENEEEEGLRKKIRSSLMKSLVKMGHKDLSKLQSTVEELCDVFDPSTSSIARRYTDEYMEKLSTYEDLKHIYNDTLCGNDLTKRPIFELLYRVANKHMVSPKKKLFLREQLSVLYQVSNTNDLFSVVRVCVHKTEDTFVLAPLSSELGDKLVKEIFSKKGREATEKMLKPLTEITLIQDEKSCEKG